MFIFTFTRENTPKKRLGIHAKQPLLCESFARRQSQVGTEVDRGYAIGEEPEHDNSECKEDTKDEQRLFQLSFDKSK